MTNEKFAEIGSNIKIYPYVVFINEQNIHLKNNIVISEFVTIHGGIKCLIGNFIHIASFSSIVGGGVCILEDFVGISAGARIITGSEMIKGEGLTNPTIPQKFRALTRSFVHLKRHSFLASDVVIHPGVTIGEGAVIGSNSVVTKDIEPWSINVGSPTRKVGERESNKILMLQDKMYIEYSIEPLDVTHYLKLKTTQHFLPQVNG